MTLVHLATPDAVAAVLQHGVRPEQINPVYRALTPRSASPATSTATPVPGVELDLLVEHICAPAVLMLATETDGSLRRARVGLHLRGATVEAYRGTPANGGESAWSRRAIDELPRLMTGLLPPGPMSAAPRLTQESPGEALRLTAQQQDRLRAQAGRGIDPLSALAQCEDLDPRLRDAITATGPRTSMSLTLHAPTPGVLEQPVTMSRLWVLGERGLYRMDAQSSVAASVLPVGDGDVLGSLLPMIDQGLRFARTAEGSVAR